MQVANQATTLIAGVYCDGLEISGNSAVTLAPGLYVVKDGPLHLKDRATLAGSGVTIFLTGNKAVLDIDPDTSVNLSAPTTGDLAGVLVFEDRGNRAKQKHVIQSRNAPNMLGAIYLPRGTLEIGIQYGPGTKGVPVAQASAWTAVVAQTVKVQDDMQIIFNTNYGATPVKPPAGISNSQPQVALTQ
jgi:hypothetical protein